MNPLIKTLVEIYGRIGDFHITPCDGAIPISEADRLAEKAVEAYAKTVWEAQAAEIKRLREALEIWIFHHQRAMGEKPDVARQYAKAWMFRNANGEEPE